MSDLMQYLGSLAGIGAIFLILFKLIYNLGKKDKNLEIKRRNLKIKDEFNKKFKKTKKTIHNLTSDQLDKLLRK